MANLTTEEKLRIIRYNCSSFTISDESMLFPNLKNHRGDVRVGRIRLSQNSPVTDTTAPFDNDSAVISNAYDMVHGRVWAVVVMTEVDTNR